MGKKLIGILLLTGLITGLNADYTSETTITKIITYENAAIIYLKDKITSDCSSDIKVSLTNIGTDNKTIFSSALTAFTTGTKVKIGFDDSSCYSGEYVKVYSIMMTR